MEPTKKNSKGNGSEELVRVPSSDERKAKSEYCFELAQAQSSGEIIEIWYEGAD